MIKKDSSDAAARKGVDLSLAPKSSPYLKSNPCAACNMRDLTLCSVLSDSELDHLNNIVSQVEYDSHAPVIDEGEPAGSLFNVTDGVVKLFKLLPDGRRQITGFLFPGDFLGIAMNDTYAYSAECVTPTKLCRFPRRALERLLEEFPHMEKRLLGLASNELVQAQDQMVLLGCKTANEKLCSFLLTLAARSRERGEDGHVIMLPMSRADIGDYLGLTTETVSRTFTSLKSSNVIRLKEGGHVELSDLDLLEDLAEGA